MVPDRAHFETLALPDKSQLHLTNTLILFKFPKILPSKINYSQS